MLGLALSLCGLTLIGCTDSDTTQAGSCGAQLHSIYSTWVRDGRPSEINMSNYISSENHYFVFTNIYTIQNNAYHCRFAVRSEYFRRRGVLAITDEKLLLWIYDDRESVIVSPELRPRFDR
jgi:hypothetical protein